MDKETNKLNKEFIKEERVHKKFEEQIFDLNPKIENIEKENKQMRKNTVIMKKLIDKLKLNLTRQDIKNKDFMDEISKLTELVKINFK